MTRKKEPKILELLEIVITWMFMVFGKICISIYEGFVILYKQIVRYRNKPKPRPAIKSQIKLQVYDRANSKCENRGCDQTHNLEIHHRDLNRNNNAMGNLVLLCPNHHKQWHYNIETRFR
jgi:hypothetical protein